MVIVPILQKEKPRHKGFMTCQDRTTVICGWQTQDPNPSFQTQGPGPRTHEVADLALGAESQRQGAVPMEGRKMSGNTYDNTYVTLSHSLKLP